MIQITYKRLVEVQMIHEYFLLKPDGSSYYDLADQGLKDDFLLERQLGNLYNLQNLVSFEASEQTVQTMKAYKLKLASSSTGFMIGIMVDPIQLGSVEQEFSPFLQLPDGLKLVFAIKPKGALFRAVTNTPLRSSLDAIYHFTNQDENNEKDFPALSLPLEIVEPSGTYPMGTLAEFSSNDIKEALEPTDGANLGAWKNLSTSRYVHEQDRLLVPHQFLYKFDTGREPLKAEFVLKKVGGGRVKKITLEGTKPLKFVQLDFSNTSIDPNDTGVEIASGIYQLDVKGETPAFVASYKVLLDSLMYDPKAIGVVELKLSRGDSDYDLLRPNGNLRTKIEADGTGVSYPSFQLLFKSRNTYWRYISARNNSLTVGTKAGPFLRSENGRLISKNPRNLTRTPTLFQEDDPATTGVNEAVFLPNPAPNSLSLENGHFYSNVYVTTIKELINES